MKQEFQDTNAYAPPLHFAPARASPEPPRTREQKSRPEAAALKSRRAYRYMHRRAGHPNQEYSRRRRERRLLFCRRLSPGRP